MTEIMESQSVVNQEEQEQLLLEQANQEKQEQSLLEQVEQVELKNLPSVTHTYKDRIFRMIFKEKKEFLELYNAMNDSSYDNPEDLTVTTLDNAIYLGMKNDVSFLLYDKLMLYEHQSTKNPNMPLRNLFYVSDVYSNLTKDKNLFGTKLIRVPEPKFVVFYNGVADTPEKFTLRLSDMYENVSEQVSLELVTQVLNINLGCNKELMNKCKVLNDYAVFVDLVRRYEKEMALELAVARAIDECIENGVLADFLKKNKAEVLKMGLYEYDEKKYIQMEREDAKEEGREEGRIEGHRAGRLLTTVSIVKKKYLKEKPLSKIADEMETDVEEIREIYELIRKNPEMEDEKLVEELIKQRV